VVKKTLPKTPGPDLWLAFGFDGLPQLTPQTRSIFQLGTQQDFGSALAMHLGITLWHVFLQPIHFVGFGDRGGDRAWPNPEVLKAVPPD
jgi:hypothetical protein